MKELAIHCSIYVRSPDGWNEDNLDNDALKILEDINFASGCSGGWNFEYQVYDTEINDI
jgi:hypothetical protein